MTHYRDFQQKLNFCGLVIDFLLHSLQIILVKISVQYHIPIASLKYEGKCNGDRRFFHTEFSMQFLL